MTYINLLNESASFGGEGPYVLCKAEGLGPAELNYEEVRGAFQQGTTLTGYRRQRREVELSIHLDGGTRARLYALRQSLSGILSPERALRGRERARLIYENDHGRWWTWAAPAGEVHWGARVGEYLSGAKVRFLCESPYWYDMSPAILRFQYGSSALQLPFTLPLRLGYRSFQGRAFVGGQMDTPVEVWVRGTGETPSLVNRSTGAALRLTSALPAGSTLYINTDPSRLQADITGADGSVRNAFGLVDVTHPISHFQLRCGINELEYEPGGDSALTEIELRWYDRFEGV